MSWNNIIPAWMYVGEKVKIETGLGNAEETKLRVNIQQKDGTYNVIICANNEHNKELIEDIMTELDISTKLALVKLNEDLEDIE